MTLSQTWLLLTVYLFFVLQYFVFDFFAHKEVFFDKVIKLSVSTNSRGNNIQPWSSISGVYLSETTYNLQDTNKIQLNPLDAVR